MNLKFDYDVTVIYLHLYY